MLIVDLSIYLALIKFLVYAIACATYSRLLQGDICYVLRFALIYTKIYLLKSIESFY